MFPKKKRVENPDLLTWVSRQPCAVCGDNRVTGRDPDHVTSRGAGGGDTLDNVMPLCRRHHTERHQYGPLTMAHLYPGYAAWLHKHGRTDILFKAQSRARQQNEETS